MHRGRRNFLKTVALGGGAAQVGVAQTGNAVTHDRTAFAYRRTFSGRQLHMISFPIGGLGAGCIGLGGRGQLRDWQIFNRADYGNSANYAFPAIWAQTRGGKAVARVLESRIMPPYESAAGLSPGNVSGLERLEESTFTGEYPLATVAFHDKTLPVQVTLEAFSPFIPLDEENSGLPVAIFRYRVTNPSSSAAAVSIVFSLDNPVGVDPRMRIGNSTRPLTEQRFNEVRHAGGLHGLLMTSPQTSKDHPMAGSLALCAVGATDESITALGGWQRAKWWASPLLFWDDFASDGRLGPEADDRNGVGSICWQREIGGGRTADYTFLIAWHFPNRTPAWCGWTAPAGEENAIIGNHYCRRFGDAWQVAEYVAANLARLEKDTRQFLAVMRESTLPAPVKEAAMANLSTLVTPTCFRTSDGRFRGFEGILNDRGCCPGSCTHVWNYESATQYLFPVLARSMREAAFELSSRMNGVMPIRIALPEGKQTEGTTAADGTMGQIMKAYLDWRLSGDDAWLRSIWPRVKQAIEFAWVKGGWDGDKDGIAEGVQHNTYDVEFYGPNPMCGIYYLGGLRAAEEMARRVGEESFAAECRRLFENGSRWIDANLFNGQYYIQKTRGIAFKDIAKPLQSRGGAEDPEHPDFQVGEGCLVDQLVGQYVADFAGLGLLVDPAHIRKTLASIYNYNYKRSLYHHDSVQRTFALNDEAALVICDYGAASRPRIPFPYFAEVMTGFEYSAAVLMLEHGMVKEGVECIENIRRRYDGERRNPWDEAECGRHYARAMAAWSGIVALSGFQYNGADKSVIAAPRINLERFTSFWSAATGWGRFTYEARNGTVRFALSAQYGKLAAKTVDLPATASVGKTSVLAGSQPVPHDVSRQGQRVVVNCRHEVMLERGQEFVVTLLSAGNKKSPHR